MGRNLARQREHLFELANVQRHHLILDLNAGSGLLTWEAVRQAPEGGVWSLAFDSNSGEALQQQAMKLSSLERPVVMIGQIWDLAYLMELRGEEEIRFDRIIGRNVFTHNIPSLVDTIAELKTKLLPGRLFLFQPDDTQAYSASLQTRRVEWSRKIGQESSCRRRRYICRSGRQAC